VPTQLRRKRRRYHGIPLTPIPSSRCVTGARSTCTTAGAAARRATAHGSRRAPRSTARATAEAAAASESYPPQTPYCDGGMRIVTGLGTGTTEKGPLAMVESQFFGVLYTRLGVLGKAAILVRGVGGRRETAA
jgi:hypothetical protein